MVISEEQHEANRENAQHSSGPTTEAGKQAVRYNAVKYGLRTRATILPWESETRYYQLWDELEAEWQPQTRTERAYLETMVTSQWLLRRMAVSEKQILTEVTFIEKQYKLLACVYKQRAQLERAFRNAVEDMKRARQEREAREKRDLPSRAAVPSRARQQAVQPPPEPLAPEPAPAENPAEPTWLMAAATDTR